MFRDKLKELRTKHNLTQVQLGEMVGVSGAYIQQLEKGNKQKPSIELIVKLSDGLGTSPRSLLQDDPKLWDYFLENLGKYYQFLMEENKEASDELEEAFNFLAEFGFEFRGINGDPFIKIYRDGNLYLTTTQEGLINCYKEISERIQPFIRYTIESELNKLKDSQS